MNPFSDKEAEVFWGNQKLEVKNFKPLTNYKKNVKLCMDMLFFVTNSLSMPIDHLTQYLCCWLAVVLR